MNLQHLNQLAGRAWNGTSFSPERRGQTFISEHEAELTEDLAAIPEDRREWYAKKYAQLCADYLSSHSNVVSSMIAGPSNFPGARMAKRSDWADNKYKFFREWRKRVLKAIERTKRREYKATHPEVEEQRKKLQRLEGYHKIMVDVNKLMRDKKVSDEDKMVSMREMGLSERIVIEIFTPDYLGRKGFQTFSLANSNANIKRVRQRIAELEAREISTPVETENANGIKVVENTPINRLQVFFPGKPEDAVRTELKRNGFRWSPSNGCWQAYINISSRQYVKKFAA